MKTDLVFEDLKLGDSVYCTSMGDGIIITTSNTESYPVLVSFSGNKSEAYTSELKRHEIDINPSLFKTNPFEKISQERVVLVRNYDSYPWVKRVLIRIVNGTVVCWQNSENVEDSKKELFTRAWNQWKELEEETEVHLTLKDISEGKGVGVPSHLIRIKE